MGLTESAREAYGGERRRWSLMLLVLVNLLPLAGVLFLDWDVAALVDPHHREHHAVAGAAHG